VLFRWYLEVDFLPGLYHIRVDFANRLLFSQPFHPVNDVSGLLPDLLTVFNIAEGFT